MSGLMNLLATQAAPEQVLLSDGARELTAAELQQEVSLLAGKLQALKLSRIALHADNGIEWVLLDLACQQAEILCVPLPLFFTAEQAEHAVTSCGLQAVLTIVPAIFAGSALPEQQELLSGLYLLRFAESRQPHLPAGTEKVTFTSGSTGTPKGVCLSTGQQLKQAMALREAVALEAPTHLCLLPLSTLLENIAGVYAPMLAGGRVEVRPLVSLGYAGSAMQNPQCLLKTIDEVRPDTLILIPQLLQLLVASVHRGWQPPALKFIAVGGAHVSARLLAEAREAGLPVYEGYGLSECSSVVSLNTPDADLPGSAGRPLPGVSVTLVNGEVMVSGNTMLGYVGDPDSWNRESVATGDLGSLDADGFLHISGRSKNLIISSYGRNIAPEWVESELQASMLFRDAVLIGDARPWCVALLRPVSDDVPDIMIQRVIDQTNQLLPDYARVHSWVRLPEALAVSGLLTANGRPRRDAIARHDQQEIADLYADYGQQTVSG